MITDAQRESLVKSAEWLFDWLDINSVDVGLIAELQAAMLIKSIPFFARALKRLVRTLYDGYIGGEFVEMAKNLISGQIRQAYTQAWKDEGTDEPIPAYLTESADAAIAQQQSFIDGYYHDIVDARVNQTAIEPLLSRVDLWTNRYKESYDDAVHQIALNMGSKERWIYGDTDHCETCAALNGIVAFASEWEAAGFKPQNAPNEMLDCGGWRCQCRREMTTERRSPHALETLMNIATSRTL